MHVFLTGPVGVGKSTVIRKTAALLNCTVGGFCTGYGADRGQPERLLYLWYPGEMLCVPERAVARVRENRPAVIPGRFDLLGCAALERARQERAELILMDECGRLEREEHRFRERILALLEEDTPILGVLGRGGEALTHHPRVKLVAVTEENRDMLPQQIIQLLKA